MIAWAAHDPELVRFARALLIDLTETGALALADWLDEHDQPTAPYLSGKPSPSRGTMLRRRTRMWLRSRTEEAINHDKAPWTVTDAGLVFLRLVRDDLFRDYIRRHFTPPSASSCGRSAELDVIHCDDPPEGTAPCPRSS